MLLSQHIASKCAELGVNIDADDYKFLDREELNNTILIGFGGSYAYGTNISTSDVDIRGIAMNSPRDIILGRGFENIVNEATDTTIYSLKKIFSLLVNCNPNTIEMLGLKEEHYLYLSHIGKCLIKNKDMFLSNRCISSFMGYANSQMYRLQQKTLAVLSDEELNEHITKIINGDMWQMLKNNYDMDNVRVYIEDGQIKIDVNVKAYPADDLQDIFNALSNVLKEYKANSTRNRKAIEHGKIAKHAMHLLRLYMMCEDMLLYGEINTYREKEHDLLMDIRNGKYLGEDEKPNKEFFDIVHDYENRIQLAKEKSVLPNKPDFKRIETFIIEANCKTIASNREYSGLPTSLDIAMIRSIDPSIIQILDNK